MDASNFMGALLPFWILIAGALVVASTAWFDADVRQAGRRPTGSPFERDRADEADRSLRPAPIADDAAWSPRPDPLDATDRGRSVR